ncbi:hypothetical protein RIR_jg41472.t1 [Rhizophagus irregularis DAOM 181602=DAOM 197198]|nr:hypothetical protein RIR_jg41472.t1 [Rhizophagus irregularis DAOM 181602=DAOM 197198]
MYFQTYINKASAYFEFKFPKCAGTWRRKKENNENKIKVVTSLVRTSSKDEGPACEPLGQLALKARTAK